jgi:hypothetical protein
MNRATILLEKVPTQQRCEEIAMFICAEHFGTDSPKWTVVHRLPEDTPLHLVDQFQAEIRERKLKQPVFLLVYGPTPAKDGE